MNADRDIVLVVDDRPANRYPIVHALRKSGFEVIEAESGRQALELAKRAPSAILLDVKLPDILGYEVCRRLKANPRTSHIPVLQLSAAFLDNESRVYALESGADAYLTQPVEPNVLTATVKSLVRLHAADSLSKLSARQWQATFDALSEGVAILDESDIVQRCNRALTELLESSYSEVEGHSLNTLISASFGSKFSMSEQHHVYEITSGAKYLYARIEPILVDGGQNGKIFVLTDVSQQKRAEHAALENERLAATGRMANTIAHEINNPLEAITNLLFLLKSSPAGKADAGGYIASAEQELARVSRISRQILSFHRDSATPTSVNLAELLDDVLALNNRAITEKNLTVTRRRNNAIAVWGFPAQLRQVFSNLVRNAIEASFAGSLIRINISRVTGDGDSSIAGARVTIADRGIGIARENMPRIFEAFFTTKELKGTGVGLWLSSAIVHEHGGRIQVKSKTQPGCSGSCISVLLPAAQGYASSPRQSSKVSVGAPN